MLLGRLPGEDAIQKTLGWQPSRPLKDAIVDLCRDSVMENLPDARSDPRYYNVR